LESTQCPAKNQCHGILCCTRLSCRRGSLKAKVNCQTSLCIIELPTVELGTFIAFLAIPFLSMIFYGKILTWGFVGWLLFLSVGALSFLLLGGVTLMMASGYEVTQSSTHEFRNATGALVGTETNSTPIINSFQQMWSYIFMSSTIVFGMVFFWVLVTAAGGRK